MEWKMSERNTYSNVVGKLLVHALVLVYFRILKLIIHIHVISKAINIFINSFKTVEQALTNDIDYKH
jgi:hypothetical protein